ncbi:glycosyltransferase [Zobellia amurskyensis]|uniref:Glycosyltransferase n=1 Tax=Zobellia amurskyensis TaxID=248905 RepID=A0A7X2ZS82_9FLAO|nr:glycosyltransferase [Zobellia amurskyensis]MUH35442.1 glycosyltransferase [Zobellia amurskyensis]
MKVLLLIDSLTSGGRERRLIELIKGFESHKDIELSLVTFSDKVHYKEVFKLGIPITIMKRVPKKNPMVFYRLYEFCKNYKPDVIHSWGTMSTILAIPASVILGVKIINGNIVNATKDMGFFDKRLLRARLTFPFSEVILGNSLAGLDAYGVPEKKRVCIYNGFGNKRIDNLKKPSIVREEFGLSDQRIVGMVASFTDKKDFANFIKAGLSILDSRNDVLFMSIGDGPNLGKCKEMIPHKYLSHFVFTGVRSDVESLVNVFDVGVLATNTDVHGEGISNSILEYMALGKPVVATTGGGTNEIVKDGDTGFLIPNAAPEVLSEKVLYLLDNDEVAEQMGAKGKARIDEVFSLKKMTSAYYELYQDILK